MELGTETWLVGRIIKSHRCILRINEGVVNGVNKCYCREGNVIIRQHIIRHTLLYRDLEKTFCPN